MSQQRPPPQLVGLGPDSTPPGGTDVGSVEQRTLGGVVDLSGKVDALQVDVRRLDSRAAKLEMMAARMLDGYHEVLGIVSVLRTRSETTDEQIGAIMGTLARVERLVREAHAVATKAERASSTNEVALDAMDALVEAKRESVRARADRRTLTVAGLRWFGERVIGPLVVVIVATLVAWLKGWL